MQTTLLVPIDESHFSRAAVGHALDLAARAPGDVHVTGLHVVNVTRLRGRWLADLAGLLGAEPLVVPEQVEAHFLARGRALLDAFSERARAAGVPHTATLDQGSVVERIVHHAPHHDLVVMSVRGETEEQFPGHGGGTAERLVRRLPTAALMLTESGLPGPDICVGVDGSAGGIQALRAAARIVRLTGGRVRAVHVAAAPSTPDPLDEARVLVEEMGVPFAAERREGEPREVLAAAARAPGCGALALGYRGRSQLKDLLLGRTTEWLLGNVDVSLLVAR